MIPYFPNRTWFSCLAGLTVCVGLVWYYLAPVGSSAFTLAFGALFVATVVLGAALRRLDRRKKSSPAD
jgi:Flp pilus assembly protein TadB